MSQHCLSPLWIWHVLLEPWAMWNNDWWLWLISFCPSQKNTGFKGKRTLQRDFNKFLTAHAWFFSLHDIMKKPGTIPNSSQKVYVFHKVKSYFVAKLLSMTWGRTITSEEDSGTPSLCQKLLFTRAGSMVKFSNRSNAYTWGAPGPPMPRKVLFAQSRCKCSFLPPKCPKRQKTNSLPQTLKMICQRGL